MKVSASPGPKVAVRGGGGVLRTSPARTSAVVARAARSAVPTLPPSRTGGRASAEIISARASSTSGRMPLPSAASWLSRMVSIARTRAVERRSPELVAWERSSRSDWASGSGTTDVAVGARPRSSGRRRAGWRSPPRRTRGSGRPAPGPPGPAAPGPYAAPPRRRPPGSGAPRRRPARRLPPGRADRRAAPTRLGAPAAPRHRPPGTPPRAPPCPPGGVS